MNTPLRMRWGAAAIIFTTVVIWMLQHPYEGLEYNDASLYSFFSLARLHPASVGTDVLVRFGSQDSFTLFGPIYAAAIRFLGLEPAASLLAFCGQLLLFTAAWRLARQLLPTQQALLAVGLLVALPADYGAQHFFRYVESFLTPRPFAEAAVLAALAANLAGRNILATVCLLGAAVLHPIMAVAGFVMLGCLRFAIPRPRLAVSVTAAAALAALLPTLIVPAGAFAPFDAEWLGLFSSGVSYLFLGEWSPEDWAYLAVPVALLAMGAITSTTDRVRNLCLAALLTAACSLAVNAIYVDLLHSVIFTQMQPWRWLWLVQCLAVLLLPQIVRDCWQMRPAGGAGLVLLAASWVLSRSISDPYVASGCVALAGIAVFVIHGIRNAQLNRPLMLGAALLLLGTIGYNLVFKVLYIPLNPLTTGDSRLIDPQTVHVWGSDGILYAITLVGVWWVAARPLHRFGPILLGAGAAALACILTPYAWHSWNNFPFPPSLYAQFAGWRALLPLDAQGIFPRTPIGDWYLLERASYYSPHQGAGDIFSRAKAVEIHRRGRLVTTVDDQSHNRPVASPLPARTLTSAHNESIPETPDLNEIGLTLLCEQDPAFDFYVAQTRLGLPATGGVIIPNPNKPANQFHLYRCADIRKNQSTSHFAPLPH